MTDISRIPLGVEDLHLWITCCKCWETYDSDKPHTCKKFRNQPDAAGTNPDKE